MSTQSRLKENQTPSLQGTLHSKHTVKIYFNAMAVYNEQVTTQHTGITATLNLFSQTERKVLVANKKCQRTLNAKVKMTS